MYGAFNCKWRQMFALHRAIATQSGSEIALLLLVGRQTPKGRGVHF